MRPTLAPLILLAAFAAPSSALDATDIPTVPGNAIRTSEDDALAEARRKIASDPGAADAVASRIMASSMASKLSQAEDLSSAWKEVRGWVKARPEDAAALALGFAKDDALGNHDFERSLTERVERYFALSPDRHRGLLGRLDKAASISKGIAAAAGGIDDDARREALKRIFEGRESVEGKVSDRPSGKTDSPQPEAPSHGEPAYAGNRLYDRLSAANPTGYSPQVLAFQSEMNRQIAPGAPKLIETGRLDHATLRHPYYGLRHDIDRLSLSLKWQRAAAQARSLGKERSMTADALRRPETQASLDAESGGKDPHPSFGRRRAALEKAEAALAAFDAEAAQTKTAARITPARLRSLSSRRQEASRWILAAAVEDWLHILRAHEGFMDAPLKALAAKLPVSAELRKSYIERGRTLEERLRTAVSDGERAASLMEGSFPGRQAEAEPLVERTRSAVRRLPRDIDEYRSAPLRLLKSRPAPSRARSWFDSAVLRWLPESARARSLRKRTEEEDAALAAFERVAGASR